MHNPQEVAELITSLTKKRGMSVNKMLQECGVGARTVDNLKVGKMPSASTITAIAQFLGVSTDYIMGAESPKKEPLIIPDELKDVKLAFYQAEFSDLEQYELDLLADIAKTLRATGRLRKREDT